MIDVGILGATGAVGQKFVELLHGHPWFRVTEVLASKQSAGKEYREAARWMSSSLLPDDIGTLVVKQAGVDLECALLFSGLDSSVATEYESHYASSGTPVISNAKNFRMEKHVPLLIPEVNPEHVELISRQSWPEGGFIVTNPNCSTVGVVCAVKPLYDRFGLDAVHVTTMQALSGAGYPGVSSMDIQGNVLPFIGGEEDKIETEPLKLLGKVVGGGIAKPDISISAQCNRVPVVDGHLLSISVKLTEPATHEQVREAMKQFQAPPEIRSLPSAPEQFLRFFEESSSPQPARHANLGQGMTVSIGRLRSCPVLDHRFVALVHNTIRGAAGGAILNAELLVSKGIIDHA